MPAFDSLQRASFAGISFPVMAVTVSGGIRDHIHEYPHAAGGAPEKLGRKLYIIKMEATFQATFRTYGRLWPQALQQLRAKFESQITDTLHIPTIGDIQAYCRTWNQHQVKGMRSGENADFEFVEDQGIDGLTESNLAPFIEQLAAKGKTYDSEKALADFNKEADISIFDAISNAVNLVTGYVDTVGALTNLVNAKLLALDSLLNDADRTVTGKDMKNWPLIAAMHELWDTVKGAQVNAARQTVAPMVYQVPTTMPMAQISITLYGDATHTVELMDLNPVEDVFAVPAGFNITFVPAVKTGTQSSNSTFAQ